MKRGLLLIGVLAALSIPAKAEPANPSARSFPDLRPDHWAAAAVGTLAVLGIFTGYPDGTFGGTRAVTRYEAALALQRLSALIDRRLTENTRRAAVGQPTADRRVPTATGGVAPERLAELTRGQEQLRRDVDELRRVFTGLQDQALGLRREVGALRERIGDLDSKER